MGALAAAIARQLPLARAELDVDAARQPRNGRLAPVVGWPSHPCRQGRNIFFASPQSTRRQSLPRQPDDAGTQDCTSKISLRFADTSSDLLFESFFFLAHE